MHFMPTTFSVTVHLHSICIYYNKNFQFAGISLQRSRFSSQHENTENLCEDLFLHVSIGNNAALGATLNVFFQFQESLFTTMKVLSVVTVMLLLAGAYKVSAECSLKFFDVFVHKDNGETCGRTRLKYPLDSNDDMDTCDTTVTCSKNNELQFCRSFPTECVRVLPHCDYALIEFGLNVDASDCLIERSVHMRNVLERMYKLKFAQMNTPDVTTLTEEQLEAELRRVIAARNAQARR
ncbi:uncharacterized protein [Haliotis asinina]|uniref:uncharacterized protein n=1 Tax=Haliotis asinina TaxID=109174 RepID=UPI003531A240